MTGEASLPAALRDFAAHVVRQVAHPLGAPTGNAADAAIREQTVRDGLATLLEDALAEDPARRRSAAAALHGHARLLSAMFQNVDLLPDGDATADRVALLVSTALHG